VVRRVRRDDRPFIGCTAYPQCRYTAPYDASVQWLAEHLAHYARELLGPHAPHVRAEYVTHSNVARELRRLAALAHPDKWQGHAVIRRPLALIDGRTYAAVWPHAQVTTTEATDKAGNIVKLVPPAVTTEQRLFIVRDNGVVFGDRGNKPFADLGLEIRLPDIPPHDKLWTTPGIKRYVAGTRPDPAATFCQVVAVITRFIDFDRGLADQQTMGELVGCYILAMWFLDAFTVIGYVWPNGEKGSGKTQLLTVIAELAYLGQVILAGGSLASLRDLADYGATLCFDDAENVMDLKRGDPDRRALLLAGNRRGNTMALKEPGNGREWRTRYVQTFCPRCFSTG